MLPRLVHLEERPKTDGLPPQLHGEPVSLSQGKSDLGKASRFCGRKPQAWA